MNSIKKIVISDHLFHKGPRPLVTVSTADIPVLHSADVVYFHRESWFPYARVMTPQNTTKVSGQGLL
jgi:hypothetical protein